MKPSLSLIFRFNLLFSLLLVSSLASAASFFNDRVSVQGYLKNAGAGINDAAGIPMRFVLKRNGTAVWCQTTAAVSPVPVINGVFSQTLTGVSNCNSLTNAMSPAVFAHAANSDTFSVDVVVDVNKDGFVTAATFAGIDLVSTPLAIFADQANMANSVSGIVPVINGGTGGSTASAARTGLGLGNVSTLNTSGVATDVLRGDGTFGAVAALSLSGDVSGLTTNTSVDKLKGRAVAATAPAANQVLGWDNVALNWTPQTVPVASVAGRTGAITINSADITDATALNTASTAVVRDATGNFSAGTITATLIGNATNVTGVVAISNGGSGASTAAGARTSLGAAASGINTDITSINGAARQASFVMAPTSGGTASAYTLTNSPAVATLAVGQTFRVSINAANVGAACLNVDGLGAKPIFSMLTAAAIASGDLQAGKVISMTYDGVNFVANIPAQSYTAASLNCGVSIAAGGAVTCPAIPAAYVNAGDEVSCTPAADPGAGMIIWSSLSTAGNISIRLGCHNGGTLCLIVSQNWRCTVRK